MPDTGKTIALVGVLGIGGYIVYEYMQYNNALALISKADPTGATTTQILTVMPFTSWLGTLFGAPPSGTPQSTAYQVIQAALTGKIQNAAAAAIGTPGTTAAGPAITSVSSAPSTTVSAPKLPPSTPQPTAQDLQNTLQQSTASPDQWNFAYRELTGYGIEQIYGGNFDAIYGSIQSSGQRPTGNITAQAFLNLPAASGLSGLGRMGAIATFYTPVINPMSSMVYRAQHPSPYRLPVGGGMSGLTQATGFEKALWAGGFVRSRRVR